MADMICPSCGKPNPPDRTTCQFCEKPLGAGELPDWLGGLRGSEDTFGAPSAESPAPAEDIFGGEGEGAPDWLTRMEEESGISTGDAPPPAAAEAGEAQPGELPDWLKGMAPQEEAAAPARPAGNLPAWLSDMSAGAEAAPAAAEQPAEEQPAQPAEEVPDWLAGMAGETPTPAAFEEPVAAEQPAQPAEELPDWLAGMGAAAAAPTPEQPAAAGGEEDWLAGLAGETPTPAVSEEPAAAEQPAQPAGDVPDWLSELGASASAAFAADSAEQADQPSRPPAKEPDWLSEMMPPAAAEPAPDWLAPGEAASPFTPESAPDWLSQEQPGEPAAAQPTPAAEMPDWLSGMGESAGAAEPPAAGGVPAFTFEEEPPADETGGESEGRLLAALPDWVSQVSADETEAAEEPGLKPADLPDWLEAMRPVGAATPSGPVEDVSSADMITAGPLTGLRGVLDADPDAIRPRKPAAFSIKLRINDEQQARVDMLKALLAGEEKAKPLPSRPIFKLQYLVRVLVALALIVPIFWVVATNRQSVPLPQPGSLPAVTDLQGLLGAVQSDSPVLVAFDYEPGFSGEMNLAASSILRRLVDQNAYLALASTSPSGPILAESMLASLNEQTPYTNYVNLGYIAGGPAGLRLFSEKPREVLPYDLVGTYAWTTTPMDAVAALADFRMLVVITDNAETARAWIEQVGPALQAKGTPLVMLVSSQAEPLVRPYYESTPRQVQALVAGLPGGAAFESATGLAGPARTAWDAFSLSLLVSVVIILVGALFSVTAKAVASSRAAKK